MGSLVRYAWCQKEMLGWIREKMAIQESALRGGKFFASNSTAGGNGALVYSNPCTLSEKYSAAAGNSS